MHKYTFRIYETIIILYVLRITFVNNLELKYPIYSDGRNLYYEYATDIPTIVELGQVNNIVMCCMPQTAL